MLSGSIFLLLCILSIFHDIFRAPFLHFAVSIDYLAAPVCFSACCSDILRVCDLIWFTVASSILTCMQVCSKTITQIPDYIQIVGIILGMCTLGYLGDKIGRKWGSVFTATMMLVGAVLLTATDGPSEKGFVIMYIVAQVCCAPCICCAVVHASCIATGNHTLRVPSGLVCNIVCLLCSIRCCCHKLVRCSKHHVAAVCCVVPACASAFHYAPDPAFCALVSKSLQPILNTLVMQHETLCFACSFCKFLLSALNFCLLCICSLFKVFAVCSSPLVTVWAESTPWLLALLLSVLRLRVVLLPGRGDVR